MRVLRFRPRSNPGYVFPTHKLWGRTTLVTHLKDADNLVKSAE